MTDDELIYGAGEALAQVEVYREALEQRHKMKVVRAYGEKLFQVERAEIRHGSIYLMGSVLRKDGTPSDAREYGVPVQEAEFVQR